VTDIIFAFPEPVITCVMNAINACM